LQPRHALAPVGEEGSQRADLPARIKGPNLEAENENLLKSGENGTFWPKAWPPSERRGWQPAAMPSPGTVGSTAGGWEGPGCSQCHPAAPQHSRQKLAIR